MMTGGVVPDYRPALARLDTWLWQALGVSRPSTEPPLAAAPGSTTPLETLVARLALTAFEHSVLLLCLAPELSLAYEAMYAQLNERPDRRQVTVDLALRVLRDAMDVDRAALSPKGRLFVWGLLEWNEFLEGRPWRAQAFALSPSASLWLQGLPIADPRLPPSVCVFYPDDIDIGIERLAPSARAATEAFAARHPPSADLAVCSADTVGEALSATRAYAQRCERPMVAAPLGLVSHSAAGDGSLLVRLGTLAWISGAILCVHDQEGALTPEAAARDCVASRLHALAASGVPVVWAASKTSPVRPSLPGHCYLEWLLPSPDADERQLLWELALSRVGIALDVLDIQHLADSFALPASHILAASAAARGLAGDRQDSEGLRDAVRSAARRHSRQALSELAERVVKPHGWAELVLPDATLRSVSEVAAAVSHRVRVFRRWRMAERTGRGTGLLALFAGSSGTGKTMSAAVIANSLGLDLYRVDLATTVSKYIGETEKNLARIFDAARDSNAILLLDEADAILGKRSEVKDAHDRHANIEVSFLLQRMEDHDGVVFLSSNLARNLDAAFARRIHYVVEFPRPDRLLRERLWRGMFPLGAPLASDVDFAFLAQEFALSGGEIQAIALDSAFLASAAGDTIGMEHVVRAVARQQTKQGGAPGAGGFKQYHYLLSRSAHAQPGA